MINLQWSFLIFSPICKVLGAFRRTRCADADVAIWFFLGAARQYARVCSLPYPPLMGRFFPRFSRNLEVGVLLPVKTGYIHFFLYNLVFFQKFIMHIFRSYIRRKLYFKKENMYFLLKRHESKWIAFTEGRFYLESLL